MYMRSLVVLDVTKQFTGNAPWERHNGAILACIFAQVLTILETIKPQGNIHLDKLHLNNITLHWYWFFFFKIHMRNFNKQQRWVEQEAKFNQTQTTTARHDTETVSFITLLHVYRQQGGKSFLYLFSVFLIHTVYSDSFFLTRTFF